MKKVDNYINGSLQPSDSQKTIQVFNPAVGEAHLHIPDSNASDVERAVIAAENAFRSWSTMNSEQRGGIMLKIASLIEAKKEELAVAETNDNGKPLWLSKTVDIPRSAANFRFFATAIQHFASESHSTEDVTNYTLRRPIGVVGCISPWNLPLYLFTWKIAPALAAGNCVVAKPSEITPLTAFMLSEICIEAGLPPGVLNIVHGYGNSVGAAIISHPKISTISFTGGSKTGAEIARVASPMFKKLSLELGGKNPSIIFADCDFEHMLGETLRSSFANQGQICLCGSRVFVEKSIYEKFARELVQKTKQLTIGDPLLPESKQGAVVSKEHMDKVLSYIDLAKKEGGNILCGGEQFTPEGRCKNGWFVQPTVIAGLDYTCRVNQEEIFGPVITLIPFEQEAEVLQWANATAYGLAATVWTSNVSRAHRFARDLEFGIVWVNCWMMRDLRTPFGGIKSSGVGREGGWEALRFFTEAKNVSIFHG